MEPLFRLLRELIEHAVPPGNKRGELHGLVDQLEAGTAEEAVTAAAGAESAVPARLPAAPPAVVFAPPAAPGAQP
jgi:hypothetical protein